MDKKTKLLIYVAASHMLLSMMAMVIHSRKRKREAPRERITYGPIDERDRMRFEYLDNKIWKNDVTCVNMLRLNKYYGDLATIFGNSVATGQWAKGSNEALGTAENGEIGGEDNGATTTCDDNGATPSASRPSKRAKVVEGDADPLIGAFDRASERLSNAITEAAKVDKKIPEGLFETVNNLPGFEHDHRSFYYAYLVNNPHIARAFDSLPFDHKITWIAKFVSDNFPAC